MRVFGLIVGLVLLVIAFFVSLGSMGMLTEGQAMTPNQEYWFGVGFASNAFMFVFAVMASVFLVVKN